MAYALIDVTTEADWRDYHDLRRSILWDARGRTGYDEAHPDDVAPAHHPLLLMWTGQAIGTVRVDAFGDGTGAIRLVTIRTALQRQGHGRMLFRLVDDHARRLGLRWLYVNAAPDAVPFYEKTGWTEHVWNAAERVGFAADCTQMRKRL